MSITPELPASFLERFAGWVRLEPRARSDDFALGLQARTADPLWMLGRQWQMGEFEGEDAGSPISAELTYVSLAIPDVALGPAGRPTGASGDLPLEALVEHEAVPLDWRTRVQIGQEFERLLRDTPDPATGDVLDAATANAAIDAYRAANMLRIDRVSEDDVVADDATCRFVDLMAGRAIDGKPLLQSNVAEALPDVGLPLSLLNAAIKCVIAWYARLHFQSGEGTSPAWQPRGLEYSFSAHAANADENSIALEAPQYRNGELDWYTFGVPRQGNLADHPDAVTTVDQFVPTRLAFGGMPHARWWAFEDNRVDFGDLDVATTDLSKLLLMEFALVYGDDWFTVPLPAALGSVVKVQGIEVTDVFGQVTPIQRARDEGESVLSRWVIFEHSIIDDPNGLSEEGILYIPPVVSKREESPPLEEVRFLRDEGANMVWGVEHTVRNGIGNPVDGFEVQLERRRKERELQGIGALPTVTSAADDLPYYKVATPVPDNWVPFVPMDSGPFFLGLGQRSIRLHKAQILRDEVDAEPTPVEPMTSLLGSGPDALLWLDEDAVTRAGTHVQLTKQRARWTNGETYVWLGKKVVTGRGEGNSGLRFDVLR